MEEKYVLCVQLKSYDFALNALPILRLLFTFIQRWKTDLVRKRDEELRGKHWKASTVLKPLLGVAYYVLLWRMFSVVYIGPDLLFVAWLDAFLALGALVGLVAVTAGKVMLALTSDRLTGRASKLRFVGTVLAGAGFIVSFVALIIHGEETSSFYFSFFVPCTIGLAGLILSDVGEWAAMPGPREEQFIVPASVLDTFQKIGVDNHFSVEEFYVFVKGEIYILLEKKFLTAYFVRLFEYKDSPHKRVWLGSKRIPLRISTAFQRKFNGLPVSRSKGQFSIPIEIAKSKDGIEEEKYVKGSGVLYWVSMYPVSFRGIYAFGPPLTERFDEPTILKIINDLSAEKPP